MIYDAAAPRCSSMGRKTVSSWSCTYTLSGRPSSFNKPPKLILHLGRQVNVCRRSLWPLSIPYCSSGLSLPPFHKRRLASPNIQKGHTKGENIACSACAKLFRTICQFWCQESNPPPFTYRGMSPCAFMMNATKTKVAEKCIAERINQNVVLFKILAQNSFLVSNLTG